VALTTTETVAVIDSLRQQTGGSEDRDCILTLKVVKRVA
jgi:hypothetical protein